MTFDGSVAPARETDSDLLEPARCDNSFLVNDEQDWSMTLINIGRLSDLARDARERQIIAEERLKAAEDKAAEAIHWLKKLHQAVADGLARTRS